MSNHFNTVFLEWLWYLRHGASAPAVKHDIHTFLMLKKTWGGHWHELVNFRGQKWTNKSRAAYLHTFSTRITIVFLLVVFKVNKSGEKRTKIQGWKYFCFISFWNTKDVQWHVIIGNESFKNGSWRPLEPPQELNRQRSSKPSADFRALELVSLLVTTSVVLTGLSLKSTQSFNDLQKQFLNFEKLGIMPEFDRMLRIVQCKVRVGW